MATLQFSIFFNGFRNFRLIEPDVFVHQILDHNAQILRKLGCAVEIRKKAFDRTDLEGAKFI